MPGLGIRSGNISFIDIDLKLHQFITTHGHVMGHSLQPKPCTMYASTLNGTHEVSRSSSTPVRAISSKISARPASLGPPPPDSYERFVKAVFRHRLEFSLFLSAAYTYVLVNIWTLWQAGGFVRVGFWRAVWFPINPWTICMSSLVWVTLSVPIAMLRKAFLTRMYCLKYSRPKAHHISQSAQRSLATTPLSMLKVALSHRNLKAATCIHFASAICALVFYIMNSHLHSFDDPKLALFVKSRYFGPHHVFE